MRPSVPPGGNAEVEVWSRLSETSPHSASAGAEQGFQSLHSVLQPKLLLAQQTVRCAHKSTSNMNRLQSSVLSCDMLRGQVASPDLNRSTVLFYLRPRNSNEKLSLSHHGKGSQRANTSMSTASQANEAFTSGTAIRGG